MSKKDESPECDVYAVWIGRTGDIVRCEPRRAATAQNRLCLLIPHGTCAVPAHEGAVLHCVHNASTVKCALSCSCFT